LISSSALATLAPIQPVALGGAYGGIYDGAVGGAYVQPVIAIPNCKIETETIYNEQCVQTYKQVYFFISFDHYNENNLFIIYFWINSKLTKQYFKWAF
jgi:hypothetical protein